MEKNNLRQKLFNHEIITQSLLYVLTELPKFPRVSFGFYKILNIISGDMLNYAYALQNFRKSITRNWTRLSTVTALDEEEDQEILRYLQLFYNLFRIYFQTTDFTNSLYFNEARYVLNSLWRIKNFSNVKGYKFRQYDCKGDAHKSSFRNKHFCKHEDCFSVFQIERH